MTMTINFIKVNNMKHFITRSNLVLVLGLTLAVSITSATAQPLPPPQHSVPPGEIKGDAWVHSSDSLAASVQQADVCLPSSVAGGSVFCGKFKDIPRSNGKPVPTLVFLHGSSGLALKAIGEWQQWLATQGFASIAPDSFTLPGRATYKSPIDKASYEKMHALRASEIAPTLAALKNQTWADPRSLILAGTSEGSVPVARYAGTEFVARILYAWSCEANYFVVEPRNKFEANKPVLNIISAQDPFFSKTNTWLGNAQALGHCATALADNNQASILLVPNAPHTLLNLPAARNATAGFLSQFVKP
jgi:dienelactone hydrolase